MSTLLSCVVIQMSALLSCVVIQIPSLFSPVLLHRYSLSSLLCCYTDIHSLLSCVVTQIFTLFSPVLLHRYPLSSLLCCYTDIHSLLSCVVTQSLEDGAGSCIGIAKLPLWGMCYLPVYSYKNELSKLLNIAHYDQELCRFAFNLQYTVIHKRVMVCTGYDQYNLLILLHDDTCTVCDAGRFAVHQHRGFCAEL